MNVGRAIVIGAAALFATIVVVGGLAYREIVDGGTVARGAMPPRWETAIAQWLLHRGVPDAVKARPIPVATKPDSPDVAAGRALYRKKCEICHAYDGSGRTEIGAAQYPAPPDLHARSVQSLPDGELFYHIRHGIRHTGMPGWELPERQIWQITAYLRNLPIVGTSAPTDSAAAALPAGREARYTGSASCKTCHEDIYARWSKTLMANVVRNPRTHPDAILPDMTKPDPAVKFAVADIAFVYGSKWKQRYFTRVGDDYFPLPAQWDVTHKAWKPYFVKKGTDWWTAHYPEDNLQRPTGPLCDGCHSVNYDVKTRAPSEWNVGCERCHGPGGEHVAHQGRPNIVNPAKLDYVAANDICISCHSQGRPLANPIEGRYYDWPVGYRPGLALRDFWKLEEHKLGETTFTHFADGSGHKNRMQGNDFVQSLMYARGVTCFSCHDVHGTKHEATLWKSDEAICFDCHGPGAANGPHAPTVEAHTHHKPDSRGSECVACHMPAIAQTIGDVNVASHTFKFVTPTHTDQYQIPNACNLCHKDKPASWATEALLRWSDRSPWRVGE